MDDELTEREKQIIGECLDALVNGSFIPDWEFSILCGQKRDEVAQLASIYPNEEDSKDMKYAINNAMNNLTGYPHRKDEELARRVSVSRDEISAIYAKWHRLKKFD